MNVIQAYEHQLAITQGNLAKAYFAIERVRELHYATLDDPRCQTCWSETYPCPTIKALDGDHE